MDYQILRSERKTVVIPVFRRSTRKFPSFFSCHFLFLFLHLDFSFIYSKFSMPFWGFFY